MFLFLCYLFFVNILFTTQKRPQGKQINAKNLNTIVQRATF